MVDAALTFAFVAGLVFLSYGAWLVYNPAGFLTAGVLLVVVPVFYTRGKWASSTG